MLAGAAPLGALGARGHGVTSLLIPCAPGSSSLGCREVLGLPLLPWQAACLLFYWILQESVSARNTFG